MFQRIATIAIFVLLSINLSGQEQFTSKSKKAIEHFKIALTYYNNKMDDQAIKEINLALGIDMEFVEAYLLKANIYFEKNEPENELECFLKAIESKPDYSAEMYYFAAECELKLAKYSDAREHLESCLKFDTIKPSIAEKAKFQLRNAKFGAYAISHPVPFDPVNMGENINSKYDEYWPSLSADEQTLVITRRLPFNNHINDPNENFQEDFYISYKIDGDWTLAESVGPPLNTYNKNEGAQSLSADGQYMYFAGCKWPDGYGRCDIYFSERMGSSWSKPRNIGPPVNSPSWESSPSISSDGRTLYFSSNRPGGKGGIDIWKSTLNDKNKWSEPENLGDSINTPGDELSPFIHPDNNTLYFSSNYWPGMGGYDIFVSRKKNKGGWTTPVNLGYPINAQNDEIGLTVNAKGNFALFSSDRGTETGKDIFQFDLYDKVRPQYVTYVKGKVYDADTKKPLRARFDLINLETNENVVQSYSNEITGEYLVCLPINHNYALDVSKEGYLFYSANFSLKNLADPSKPYRLDVPMQPVEVGKTVVLKNIFFDTDLFNLKPESISELNKLVSFMNLNPGIKVEIGGHTDNVGDNNHNILLSQNRAKAVFDYLISKKIGRERLTYAGYSFSKPIDSNETDQGRANNRRTEFKIIAIRK